jgi:hypothetical protein
MVNMKIPTLSYPTEISEEDRDKIWSILTKTPIDEGTCGYTTDATTGEKLDTPGGIKEMYAEPSKFSYPPLVKSLTKYMLDKGMNIKPLPKVKFIDNDVKMQKISLVKQRITIQVTAL